MILLGDSLEVLKTLPSESVNMCVTSPPYYALRDYGTGRWEGGSENCDHVANAKATKKFGNDEFNKNRPSREETHTAGYFKAVCPKCGAVRVDSQIGLEDTPQEYIQRLVDVFHEVNRVLKNDGTLWVNIGDSYCNTNGFARANEQWQREGRNDAPANDRKLSTLHESGLKTKDLIGIPWMLAFALRADGWYLRQDIIWQKPNPMPESVTDRCTRSHEYIFLLSKHPQYYFDNEAIKTDSKPEYASRYKYAFFMSEEMHGSSRPNNAINTVGMKEYDGKANKRDVWSVSVNPYRGAHFATFPEKLVEPCILSSTKVGGVVLDCFSGAGTTGVVCERLGREYIGIELNPEYVQLSEKRIDEVRKEMEMEKAQVCFW